MSNLMKTLATGLVGVGGAILTGGATAAVAYVQANGVNGNWQAIGTAAAMGGITTALAYLTHSPLQK